MAAVQWSAPDALHCTDHQDAVSHRQVTLLFWSQSAAANRAAFRPFRAPVRSTVRTPAAAAAMDAQAVAQHLARLPFPPHMPLAGAEKGSFAEGTIAKRLPAILENTVKDMLAEAAGASPEVAAQIKV